MTSILMDAILDIDSECKNQIAEAKTAAYTRAANRALRLIRSRLLLSQPLAGWTMYVRTMCGANVLFLLRPGELEAGSLYGANLKGLPPEAVRLIAWVEIVLDQPWAHKMNGMYLLHPSTEYLDVN
jgi:hypothetical protein